MPQRNPKLVASLLAEIDTHLNSEDDLGKSAGGDGWASGSAGVQSPFQGDGEGLEALDMDAARRAKVLREALRSMNKGVPSTDATNAATISVCTQT